MESPGDDSTIPVVHEDFEYRSVHALDLNGTSWSTLWEQVWIAGVAQLFIAAVCMVAEYLYTPTAPITGSEATFRGLMYRCFGALDEYPKRNNRIFTCFIMMQFVFSSYTCVNWVHKSYEHELNDSVKHAELGFAGFFILHYIILATKSNFNWRFVWGINALVDVLTIVPLLIQGYQNSWLSLSYVRCLRMLQAYYRIERSGIMENVNDFIRGIIIGAINFLTLVYFLAATEFLLEVLGPISEFEDEFILTRSGDYVSMWQMYYWMITTISTVGYGDFSPKTLVSRGFTAVAIIVGVVFFTVQSGEVYNLKRLEENGGGKFYRRKSRGHAIIVGGAVNSSASVVLRSFLTELLHVSHFKKIPDVVLLGKDKLNEEASALIHEPFAKQHTTFLRGTALTRKALFRARCENADVVYILANIFVENLQKEDEANILVAASILKHYPGVPVRLMLLRPESRTLAVNIGIDINMCFALNEWKGHLLAQTCKMPGFIPLIYNMVKSRSHCEWELQEKRLRSSSNQTFPMTWQQDFDPGARFQLHGMIIPPPCVGRPFIEAAKHLFHSYGIYLIGVQHEGQMKMNPDTAGVLRSEQVVFVAAPNLELLERLAAEYGHKPDSWIALFLRERTSSNQKHPMDSRTSLLPSTFQWHDDDELAQSAPPHAPQQAWVIHPGKMTGLEKGVRAKVFAEPPKTLDALKAQLAQLHAMVEATGGSRSAGEPIPSLSSRHLAQKIHSPDFRRRLMAPRFSLARPGRPPPAPQRSAGQGAGDANQLMELDQVVRNGGHYVLVLLSWGIWPQLEPILFTLREEHLPEWHPVVVIAAYPRLPECNERFKGVLWVQGNPQHVATLNKAGIHSAQCVALLSGAPKTVDPLMMDQNAVLTASVIESQLAKKMGDVPVILDLNNPSNVNQLMHETPLQGTMHFNALQSTKRKWKKAEEVSKQEEGSAGAGDVVASCPRPGFLYRQKSKLSILSKIIREMTWCMECAMAMDKGSLVGPNANFSPRISSGRVMNRVDLCAMFASSFYTPGILEMMENLCLPALRKQSSFVWTIPLGFEYVDRPFSVLLDHLTKDGALPIALLRAPGVFDNKMPYVRSFPSADLKLHRHDQVFVIGSNKWAKPVMDKLHLQNQACRLIQRKWIERWMRVMNRRKTLMSSTAHSFKAVVPPLFSDEDPTAAPATFSDIYSMHRRPSSP